MRHLIVGMPKAGNNLLATYLERKLGIKRAASWGISAMDVLQPTRAALLNKVHETGYQGIIAGIFMQAEVATSIIVHKLNAVKDNEYIIAHMPYSLMRLVPDDFKVHIISRDLRGVVESNYHYIHNEKNHPLHKLFTSPNGTWKTAEDKYRWLIHGKVFRDINFNGIHEQAHIIDEWTMHYPWYTYEHVWELQESDDNIKEHVFRKGTPGNYRDTMPEEIQEEIYV